MPLIEKQEWLVNELKTLTKELRTKSSADAKKQLLCELISKDGKMSHLLNFNKEVRLPTKPHIIIQGIVPSKCKVFKSALTPIMVCFRAGKHMERVMWKCGDDLRQDQMILQFIKLMDNILKKESLDMKLTAFVVVATGPETGFLEFVADSDTVAGILKKNGNDIKKFITKNNPKPKETNIALQILYRVVRVTV
eukprot:UN27843